MYLCLLNALSISPSFKGMEKWDFMITNNFTAIKYYVPEVIFWTLRFTSSASQQFFEVKYCYPLKKYYNRDLLMGHHLQLEKCFKWHFCKWHLPWLVRLDQESSVQAVIAQLLSYRALFTICNVYVSFSH